MNAWRSCSGPRSAWFGAACVAALLVSGETSLNHDTSRSSDRACGAPQAGGALNHHFEPACSPCSPKPCSRSCGMHRGTRQLHTVQGRQVRPQRWYRRGCRVPAAAARSLLQPAPVLRCAGASSASRTFVSKTARALPAHMSRWTNATCGMTAAARNALVSAPPSATGAWGTEGNSSR